MKTLTLDLPAGMSLTEAEALQEIKKLLDSAHPGVFGMREDDTARYWHGRFKVTISVEQSKEYS